MWGCQSPSLIELLSHLSIIEHDYSPKRSCSHDTLLSLKLLRSCRPNSTVWILKRGTPSSQEQSSQHPRLCIRSEDQMSSIDSDVFQHPFILAPVNQRDYLTPSLVRFTLSMFQGTSMCYGEISIAHLPMQAHAKGKRYHASSLCFSGLNCTFASTSHATRVMIRKWKKHHLVMLREECSNRRNIKSASPAALDQCGKREANST